MYTDTVSVAPLTVKAKHYGSAYAMTDYTSKSHYFYLTTGFSPNAKIRTFGTLSFTKSEASLDEVVMPNVEDLLNGDLTHQDFTFPKMQTYSDLNYGIIRISLGVSVRLSPRITWTATGDYADLSDDAAYVYGDESGSLSVIKTGLKIDF